MFIKMLNSSSLDTDDRWAWKRPCSLSVEGGSPRFSLQRL